MTTVGLEPTIFGSEDRRLIHWATRPLAHSSPAERNAALNLCGTFALKKEEGRSGVRTRDLSDPNGESYL